MDFEFGLLVPILFMSSPVGHSLVGLSLYFLWNPYKRWEQVWEQKWEILTAVILANLPDIDILAGMWIYGDRHAVHRTFTHSPFFALLLAIILSLFSPIEKRLQKIFQYFILIFSHGFMDFFCGDELGHRSGQGVAIFYPWITKKYTSPFALFPSVDFKLGIWSLINWETIAFETVVFGIILLLVIQRSGKKFQS